MSDSLNISRRKLNDVLGDKTTKYFNHIKQWFRMKLTKEEFDAEARVLLSPDQVHFHNEFLLALLNKVEGLAETSISIAQEKAISHNRNSRRHKRNSRTSEKSNFEPAELLEYLPPNSPPGAGSDGVKYASQEIFLPDHALVVGRFMLAAWELGLEGADDEAADLIVVAVQNFLKNIISAVISQRKGYKQRNKRFMYDIGRDMPNMWLRNTSNLYDPQNDGRVNLDDSPDGLGPRCPPTMDEVEQSAAYEIACSLKFFVVHIFYANIFFIAGIPETSERRTGYAVCCTVAVAHRETYHCISEPRYNIEKISGHRWRNTRKFLTPAFHFNILQNFLPMFLKNEKILIKKLQEIADGRCFNALPIMALTALDNVTESIMGVSVNAQSNSESKYVKSIETLAKIVSLRMRNPFIGEDALFNFLSLKKQQDEAVNYVHGLTRKVITARREDLESANITKLNQNGQSDIGIKNKHAFLDLLLLAEVDGEKIKDDQVREEVDIFMFEGHDTTASGLAFALYCISKRPDVQEKILEEQKVILGQDLHRDPTYSQIHQMKYLELVIKETLRLYPSVPLIERMITEDIQLGELKIRKNTSVIVNIFELQRHLDLYDNPLEFHPERFDTASANSAKNAFSWLAFSAGPRNCIGQKFAMLELKATLAGIVKHFHLLPDKIDQPVLCAELILRSECGVPIKLKPRIPV